MAKFLRDQNLKNITVTEQMLDLINEFLEERELSTNEELTATGANDDEKLLLNYIIRFDNRGYKLVDYADVKKYYSQATEVERMLFTLDSTESVKTNRLYGTFFEIRLDSRDPKNTFIQVSSDDGDAVDSVFCGLIDIVTKFSNHNGKVRNTWSQLLVQVLGVAAGFTLSLIAGLKVAPFVKFENSFVITFIFSFLIFSNAWGFINQQILRYIDYAFPNIKFSRQGKSTLHWLSQALVGGIVVAFTLLLISSAFDWIGKVLSEYIGT
ncbi:hypothetical protein EKG38_17160 [Shewanella canadensis]|uniref:Uncharacterized protein n=1 Tax=Shewanella canadensis TaxID=271096 RepID=A0A3S0LKM5_9GAMM|nr:hypothetical protein [Shewanella canadensis]RTR37748.1 hypothetical protein EKG38_17160 [Shewanella canadensis]